VHFRAASAVSSYELAVSSYEMAVSSYEMSDRRRIRERRADEVRLPANGGADRSTGQAAIWRQASSHLRQASAQRRQASLSAAPFAHSAAHSAQISAHSRQTAPIADEPRAMSDAASRHISAQSRHALAQADISPWSMQALAHRSHSVAQATQASMQAWTPGSSLFWRAFWEVEV